MLLLSKMTTPYITTKLSKHDDYMTPKSAWETIQHLIPKDKTIWEPFYGDGQSGRDLTSLGFNVIHEDIDFFENDKGEIIVSNPPFSKSKEVLARLRELEKPFMVIMPTAKINTQYFRKLFCDTKDPIQIIIPRKRIHFKKLVDGEPVEGWKDACAFDCFWYCYKFNLPRDINWLEE